MGLAAPKSRRKLAHDPNNTKWTRNESTFGHKILRAHGWEPGQYLGAQNAAQAELHSVASAAPIQVLLKDDTLGLGAKQAHRQNNECTGLDGFKDLLGRLNGKSEESIEKERKIRSDIKMSLYVERRFGTMRFVKGGLLVGDQMKETPQVKVEDDDTKDPISGMTLVPDVVEENKKTKKRKAEADPAVESSSREKKKKKGEDREQYDNTDLAEDARPATELPLDEARKASSKKKSKKSKYSDDSSSDQQEAKDKKEKKKKDKKRRKGQEATGELSDTQADPETAKISKEERRRIKKEKKKAKKTLEEAASAGDGSLEVSTVATPLETTQSTPAASGTSTPQMSARHLARSRNIASKRQAMADMAALNQIFMVKAV